MGKMIKNYSLSDQVYDFLKESIISGELQPGDRILELEIAKNYNISQAPVREALSRLNKEGFVIHHRHKGTFVSNFSQKNIEEIYSFRRVVEPFAMERAIQNITNENLEMLSEIYQKMVEAGENDDLLELRKLDEAFHSYIYQIADHEFMFQVWENLSGQSSRVWHITSQIYFDNLGEVAAIHKPILDALCERNTEKCIQAFFKHMNHVWETLSIHKEKK